MPGPQITLVRHPEWDRRSDGPTGDGERQAQAARTRLEETLQIAGAVVLSSAAKRAMYTFLPVFEQALEQEIAARIAGQ